MKKCLEGLRVLELSQFISAPYAGQMLADLGADVIKVELPGEGKGDIARKYDPMYKEMSLYFASYNRNKRFLTLNLKTPEGQEIFRDLVRRSDVVLDNFRPGVMEKMNLGYEQLKEVNPGIIMASLSGFGQTGPNVHRQALDMSIQALSGFMDVTGFQDGPPTKGGPVLSDFIAGLYLAVGILAAYAYRQRTGMGQYIDIALFDTMFVLMENYPAIYRMSGEVPVRSGNGRPFSAPVGTYQAKDGKCSRYPAPRKPISKSSPCSSAIRSISARRAWSARQRARSTMTNSSTRISTSGSLSIRSRKPPPCWTSAGSPMPLYRRRKRCSTIPRWRPVRCSSVLEKPY